MYICNYVQVLLGTFLHLPQLREEIYSELCNVNQVAGVKVCSGHMVEFKVCELLYVFTIVAEVS